MVVNVIEDGLTRCEVYVNANAKVVITIGPAHGDMIETQGIEMDEEDLRAFIKMCRAMLRELNDR